MHRNLIFIGISNECIAIFQKVQKPFAESDRFFCDPDGPGKRSDSIPNSVHQLRPGDIDIIAAMGDSLTAGSSFLTAMKTLSVFIHKY